jgi:1A family penicillin-binding protein
MRRLLPTYLWLAVAAALLLGGLFLLWVVSLDIPSFDNFDERVVRQSTKIYDRTGETVLYDVHENVKRQLVPSEEIAKEVKNATVAIEDSEFYEHAGVKPTAFLRAVLVNIVAGGFEQGGSTITQQVVKNSLLTSEKLISRKLKEWVLAIKMEQTLTKEEILTLYLNEAPYGGSIYGVEEASQAFFRKSAAELTLAEAAYLAAIPKAPTYYSPSGPNREALEERKDLVLERMAELGFITAEEAAATKKILVTFQPPVDQSLKAPHFVMWIIDQLESKYGREALYTRGFKVTTTLDWEWQQKGEEIVARLATENLERYNARNAGLVAVDPKTGQVLTMVGSKDYFDVEHDGNFNVTLAHRQPGSSFKPFVYAEAFNKGYTPETVVFDLPTQFDTGCARNPANCYTPVNYDGQYHGPITLRNALAQSVNVPAIKVLYLAGIRDALRLAQNFGLDNLNDPNRYGLTLVLGGGEVSLLNLTGAYATLANDGVRHPVVGILKIEDNSGNLLEEFKPAPRTVVPPNTARLVTSILTDNAARTPAFGANSLLYIPSRPVAAKTGTTNDYRDAWILGYAPNVAVGAWAGNNDNSPMEKRVAGFIVAPIWQAFMSAVLPSLPVETFPPAQTIGTTENNLKPIMRGFWQGGETYFIDKISGRLATENTPQDLREERVLASVHSILHWVDKNNPLGPSPANPASDPQYSLWEPPVRAWAAQNGYRDEDRNSLPAGYDDVHDPEFAPQFNLTSPNEGQTYSANQKVTVRAQVLPGRFPPGQMDVFLNDLYLGSAPSAPFELSFIPTQVENIQSTNELRVIFYDSVRNKTEKAVTLKIGS